MTKLHILYLPGLGDRNDGFRQFCLSSWKLWGVTTELVPSVWYDGRDLAEKSERAIRAIKEAENRGQKVVLIGESAGGALALNVAAKTNVHRVITLCGVATGNTPISPYIRKRAPALDEAVKKIDSLQINAPIVSLRGILDTTVGKRYSTARGARPYVIAAFGHLMTIVFCLTIYAPYVIRLVKR